LAIGNKQSDVASLLNSATKFTPLKSGARKTTQFFYKTVSIAELNPILSAFYVFVHHCW